MQFKDPKLSVYFETQEMMEDTLILLRFNCPDSECAFIGNGWGDLRLHVRATHGKLMWFVIRFSLYFFIYYLINSSVIFVSDTKRFSRMNMLYIRLHSYLYIFHSRDDLVKQYRRKSQLKAAFTLVVDFVGIVSLVTMNSTHTCEKGMRSVLFANGTGLEINSKLYFHCIRSLMLLIHL